MSEKVKVLRWETEDCGEPPVLYRLDERGAGERFFQNILDNAEIDGREIFTLVEMSKATWKSIEVESEKMA